MEAFSLWLADIVSQLGYTEIVFLMALESSLFPVPSELVMIPAGYRAAQGELNPFLATLAGGGGSMIGASANYVLGKYLGRAFLVALGYYFGEPVIKAVVAYTHEAGVIALAGLLVFVIWFVIKHRSREARR